MQVTDDRALDLRNFSTDHPVPRQKRQGRRIVAEQQNPLVGTHRRKRGSHLSEMFFPQFFPTSALFRKHVGGEYRKREQRGRAVQHDVAIKLQFPERLYAQFRDPALPAFQTQPAPRAHESQLAEFVIPKTEPKPVGKSRTQFSHALLRAF